VHLVSDLYIPRIGPHISGGRIGRSFMGIYKSLKKFGNWDSGRAIPFLGILVSNFRHWIFGYPNFLDEEKLRDFCNPEDLNYPTLLFLE
jgi:hypothetical protein